MYKPFCQTLKKIMNEKTQNKIQDKNTHEIQEIV